MNIIAFGDSWVFGDELANDDLKKRESINLTGIIRDTYKLPTHNFAINGASMDEIILQIISYINSPIYDKTNLLLIGLTSPIRKYHYNNILKDSIRWPAWDWDSYKNYGHKKLTNDPNYETWFKLNFKYNVNVRNQIIEYFKSVLVIKTLLSKCDNYIVWQSIDGDFYEKIEKDYSGFMVSYTDGVGETKNSNAFGDDIFCKDFLNNLIKNDSSETQIWLNISEPSWQDWLHNNFDNIDDVFFNYNFHPTHNGIKLWFNGFLKKYIDKVLDTSK